LRPSSRTHARANRKETRINTARALRPDRGHGSGTRRRPLTLIASDIDGAQLAFRYHAGSGWQPFGPTLDATILSDEHAAEFDAGQIRVLGFTGAFVGLWVWDLTGHGHYADFDDTTYSARVL
jgi:beta-xylosidase